MSTIWIILLFATNLSEDYALEFEIFIDNGVKTENYHVAYCVDGMWTIDMPYKNDSVKTIPVNYMIDNETTLKTLFQDNLISIEQLCDVPVIDWGETNEIVMSKELQKEGWTDIKVHRTENGFTLSQKKGVLEGLKKIEVKWLTRKH